MKREPKDPFEGLSPRARNVLRGLDARTLDDVALLSKNYLVMMVRNCGHGTATEIDGWLRYRGISGLRETDPIATCRELRAEAFKRYAVDDGSALHRKMIAIEEIAGFEMVKCDDLCPGLMSIEWSGETDDLGRHWVLLIVLWVSKDTGHTWDQVRLRAALLPMGDRFRSTAAAAFALADQMILKLIERHSGVEKVRGDLERERSSRALQYRELVAFRDGVKRNRAQFRAAVTMGKKAVKQLEAASDALNALEEKEKAHG